MSEFVAHDEFLLSCLAAISGNALRNLELYNGIVKAKQVRACLSFPSCALCKYTLAELAPPHSRPNTGGGHAAGADESRGCRAGS